MKNPRKIIGLHSDFPQSGKSTIALALGKLFRARVYSIASGIRDVAVERGMPSAAYSCGEYKDVPDPALNGMTPRQVLISIGEEFTSQHGKQYWIDRLFDKINQEDAPIVVIDDVRRFEEGAAVELHGGTVITIQRDDARKVQDVGGWVPTITVNNNAELNLAVEAVAGLAGIEA